ncbi:MAG: pyrophosphokinae [Pseudomonadota bacterium]|nr:pyrophosphokinae [Pseudomonadota bacterium]
MEKTRPQAGIAQRFSFDEYLQKLTGGLPDAGRPVYRACRYAWDVQDKPSDLPASLDVALILNELGVDETTLIVTLLSDSRLQSDDFFKHIRDEFGNDIHHMVKNLRWMHDLNLDLGTLTAPEQAERLRRMLLAMVEDVRVVLIKLAFRVQRLRMLANTDDQTRQNVARETLEIYAPIANRLGIGQLKWELEDLSFRYLEPLTYRRVAKMLEEKREEREQYIHDVVTEIKQMLLTSGVKADVYGRPKHIYSIWKKMQGKQKDFDELFDVRAVRITVDTVAECYLALGLVHGKWRHIAKEFDDYIANPKENGYQSLHTAVYGPENKPLEIQIRTRAMHEFAEYGVAAHWLYKEGSSSDRNLQKGIASLRKLLDPSETRDEELVESFHTELFPDRVFVLTPKGKVMDLQQGSTPLDFAYVVHTDIGHRCRGAKVNGRIVPLTYELQNGERVEILTASQPAPSRDWMNPNLGFLKTDRARAKVRSWFRQADFQQNQIDGKATMEREIHRLDLHKVDVRELLKYFKLQTVEEMYAAIGHGDISTGQVDAALHECFVPRDEQAIPLVARKTVVKKFSRNDEVRVRGVGNLLTTMASCCKPVPGDDIIGFITRGQGVVVHRQDCVNIINLENTKRDRLIEVEWGESQARTYEVSLQILAIDRQGLLRDVSKVLADEKVDVIGVNTLSNRTEQTADMTITVEISDLQQLGRVMDKIGMLPNIVRVSRGK